MNIKESLNTIVFGTDTRAGKNFDLVLLWVIFFSVAIVMFESIPTLGAEYQNYFIVIEYILTAIFTLEYLLRIFISSDPKRYIFSFWGLIDLLSVLPTYISLVFVGYHYLLIVRIFRLLRVFRILKLVRFNQESKVLIQALKGSSYKISIFLIAVLTIAVMMGTVMYVIEGGTKGFTSIPQSIYWAIVTITTVGYGDVVPTSVLGKLLSSFAMLLGYAIIAVPTGLVTAEFTKNSQAKEKCSNCDQPIEPKQSFCGNCGVKI